mmetsp:Transcript_10864/g.36602  ORF Transcript_10864/g.36602 Transcript_10864/m.36602 type:complete len:139 (-) Transcript_10864:193-609(-)
MGRETQAPGNVTSRPASRRSEREDGGIQRPTDDDDRRRRPTREKEKGGRIAKGMKIRRNEGITRRSQGNLQMCPVTFVQYRREADAETEGSLEGRGMGQVEGKEEEAGRGKRRERKDQANQEATGLDMTEKATCRCVR